MDNNLAKFMGRKDLKNAITSVEVVQGTAKDSGNIYYAIELKFVNGYTKRMFLRSDESFAWANAFDLIDVQRVVDSL